MLKLIQFWYVVKVTLTQNKFLKTLNNNKNIVRISALKVVVD